MREFWVSSAHHLAVRTEGGGLLVTDELLLAYLARPELMPPPEACRAERELHAALSAAPRRPVAQAEVAAIEDADARENWTLMLAFRGRLLTAATVEAAYLGLVRSPLPQMPPLFLNQLVHLILRNALDECHDPYVLRAAELFFRPQRVTLLDGAAILADAEIIEAEEQGRAPSPLADMLGRLPRAELDVLDDANAWTYWSRSDAFTMALNISASPKSRAGLARAIESWIRHLLHLEVEVEAVAQVVDSDWRWFVGLDQEGTRIGNAVWNGEPVPSETLARLLALFRLRFRPGEARLRPDMAGHPAYLLLAMTPDRRVLMKPQNIVAGLPLLDPGRPG
ncbi:DUF6352 family protein [uncultured Enterovirga sp.]|uniref:DUF6352 family protein n=1 Tax=uncultured Enterovirga sp. TaxID=2026352 RepID=UPI0035C956BD